jgi:hypothetical protein
MPVECLVYECSGDPIHPPLNCPPGSEIDCVTCECSQSITDTTTTTTTREPCPAGAVLINPLTQLADYTLTELTIQTGQSVKINLFHDCFNLSREFRINIESDTFPTILTYPTSYWPINNLIYRKFGGLNKYPNFVIGDTTPGTSFYLNENLQFCGGASSAVPCQNNNYELVFYNVEAGTYTINILYSDPLTLAQQTRTFTVNVVEPTTTTTSCPTGYVGGYRFDDIDLHVGNPIVTGYDFKCPKCVYTCVPEDSIYPTDPSYTGLVSYSTKEECDSWAYLTARTSIQCACLQSDNKYHNGELLNINDSLTNYTRLNLSNAYVGTWDGSLVNRFYFGENNSISENTYWAFSPVTDGSLFLYFNGTSVSGNWSFEVSMWDSSNNVTQLIYKTFASSLSHNSTVSDPLSAGGYVYLQANNKYFIAFTKENTETGNFNFTDPASQTELNSANSILLQFCNSSVLNTTTTTQNPNTSTTSTTTHNPSITSTTTTTLNPNTTTSTTTTQNPLTTTSTTTTTQNPLTVTTTTTTTQNPSTTTTTTTLNPSTTSTTTTQNPNTTTTTTAQNTPTTTTTTQNPNTSTTSTTSTTTTQNPNTTTSTTCQPISGYTRSISMSLGYKYTGMTNLSAQFINTNGQNYGCKLTTGFVDVGFGNYLLTTQIPFDFRGALKFYSGLTFLGAISINSEEYEYVDVRVSSRCTGVGIPATVTKTSFSTYESESIEFRITDDYYASEGRSLDITFEGYPSLIGALVTFEVDGSNSQKFVKYANILSDTTLRIELIKDELQTIGAGRWNYEIKSILSNGHVLTLAIGNIIIIPPFGD